MARRLLLLLFALSLLPFSIADAHAGRRGLRVDVGAWFAAVPIAPYAGPVTVACPGAGVAAELNFPPLWQQGYVGWNGIQFQTTPFYGLVLSEFYCQHARPYTAFADPAEYLNASIFPPDEQDLAHLIGVNADNAVTAVRYSFTGTDEGVDVGRQWSFYFFPGDLTIVALYGVPDDGSAHPFENILDLQLAFPDPGLLWDSERDGFDGQYFCFQGREYIGDCVPPAPEPEVPLFSDSFESGP